MAFVVIWQGPGGDTSHCRVFREQASAEEAAQSRRIEGATVTVVDTQWGGRAVISSDAPTQGAEQPQESTPGAGGAG